MDLWRYINAVIIIIIIIIIIFIITTGVLASVSPYGLETASSTNPQILLPTIDFSAAGLILWILSPLSSCLIQQLKVSLLSASLLF